MQTKKQLVAELVESNRLLRADAAQIHLLGKDLIVMRKALEAIASGVGHDLLGSNSMSREDMQVAAKSALEALPLSSLMLAK